MAHANGPRGVGGWLVFFLFLRILGVAITALLALSIYLTMSWVSIGPERAKWILIRTFGVAGLISAADLYMFCSFLRSRRWRTVQIAIVLLCLQALPWLPTLRVFFYPSGADTVRMVGMLTPALVAVASAAIWSLYLLRSKRVANTYLRRGDVDADDLTGVFE